MRGERGERYDVAPAYVLFEISSGFSKHERTVCAMPQKAADVDCSIEVCCNLVQVGRKQFDLDRCHEDLANLFLRDTRIRSIAVLKVRVVMV